MRVLIVSDDQVFARLVTRKFESWGHRPSVATTGTEAYELIRQQPFRFVITGANVPGLSGPELCRKIRKLKRDRYIYVVICENQDKAVLQAGAESLGLMAGLQGVANNASMREFFRLMLADYRRTKRQGALIFVHIDGYDRAFAEHGYDTTQRMMAEIAAVLKRSARDCDLVARYADDEFCIMLHDTHWDKCMPVAERIITNAESISIVVGDETLHPHITIKAVNFPMEDLSVDDILALPDRISYAA